MNFVSASWRPVDRPKPFGDLVEPQEWSLGPVYGDKE
jgi:hypothetical protein